MRTRLLYAESPEWGGLLERADAIMDSAEFQQVKREGRTRAGFVRTADGRSAFLKCSEARSLASGLFDRVRGSRAARALRGAAILRGAGFLCPRPLAAMDVFEKGALRCGYLLSEAIDNAQIPSRFALGRSNRTRQGHERRKLMFDGLARELRRLHDAGIYTRDLQQTNVMVEQCEAGVRFYFLDLEDFRSVRRVSRRRRMLNLVHLDRSIGRFVRRAARLKFLYTYAGSDLSRTERRRLVAQYLEVRRGVERDRRKPELADSPGRTGAQA